MSARPHLRLRKYLDAAPAPATWPAGMGPAAFGSVDARALHHVLELSFPGLVAPFADWYGNLTQDDEFDATLCVAALAEDGSAAGFIQCWTSNFIKDLAIAPAHRGKGVGAALMQLAFGLFAARGAPHVDLKVETGELAARQLYVRLGMVVVPL